jgi:phosphate transport system substrate-binding protein
MHARAQWRVLFAMLFLPVWGVLGADAQESTPAAPVILPYEPRVDLSSLEGKIVVDGSSTVYPITDEAAIQFMDFAGDVEIEVAFSGTGGGFTLFCNGETDVQNASRPIEADEMAACAASGIGYYVFEVAYDGISIVVNPENDFVTCLTVAQLKLLWQPDGHANTWQDLDPTWPDREIELYGPGPRSGTFDYFTAAVVGAENASRTDYYPSENDLDLVLGVADHPDGLGYFGFAYYEENHDDLKLVAVDNGDGCIQPSPVTIADGTYAPLSRPLYVYVKVESLARPEIQEFVRFYLANAQQIAVEVGYVAAPAAIYVEDQAKIEGAIAGMTPPDGP